MGLVEEIAEERTVRPGRTLFVRKVVVGDLTEAPTFNVLVVHGTNGTQTQFDPMIHAVGEMELMENNKCINFWLYDMAGCGKSPAVDAVTSDYNNPSIDAYSNEESVLDLKAILTDMIDKTLPTYFLGFSYGPTIILQLLNDRTIDFHEDYSVQGMVFISTALREGPLALPDGGPFLMKCLPKCVLECLHPYFTESFLKSAFHPSTMVENPSVIELTRRICQDNKMDVCKAYLTQHQWATTQQAQAAKDIPVFVIHGAEDNLIAPGCAQHISNELARSKLQYVEHAGHLVILEKPTEIAKLVMDFFIQIQCVYLVRDGFPPMS